MVRKKVVSWVFISLILATFNFYMLVGLFGLAHQFDSNQPSQWVRYLFSGTWFFFAPVGFIILKITNVIGTQGNLVYIGLFNGIIWANAIMYFASKNRKVNDIFNRLLK